MLRNIVCERLRLCFLFLLFFCNFLFFLFDFFACFWLFVFCNFSFSFWSGFLFWWRRKIFLCINELENFCLNKILLFKFFFVLSLENTERPDVKKNCYDKYERLVEFLADSAEFRLFHFTNSFTTKLTTLC
ncbi:MAG TPA: hypothetical protein DD629_01725 [Treponema sp.]|nr:hypothetical protein [Treponema sp.]